MKLLFVHDGPLFYDKKGNYYEYAYHGLLERYSYIADEITFLMRTVPLMEQTKNTLVPEKIRVVSVPDFKSPSLYFKEKPRAEKIIEREVKESDCMILRGSSCSDIAVKYAERYSIPYIYECVGCVWDSLWNYSLLGKAMALGSFLKTRKIIRNADYVYYVTNEFLQRRYPTKGKSVGCSDVIISLADDAVLSNRLERVKDIKKHKRIILGTAAAIDVRYKGEEYVIKAIPELVKNGYDVEYHLAGSNRLNSTFLYNLAKSYGVEGRVIFCGSLTSEQMIDFYDSLDIYIQPSKLEGLSRAVIEALSRACLTIGTNVGGIPELLQEQCLFKKGNSREICRVILDLVQGDMKSIIIENIKKAKEYELEILNQKRKQFYEIFLNDLHTRRRDK